MILIQVLKLELNSHFNKLSINSFPREVSKHIIINKNNNIFKESFQELFFLSLSNLIDKYQSNYYFIQVF